MFSAGDVRIENVPDAILVEPTDTPLRVTRAICGSDLWPYWTLEQPRDVCSGYLGRIADRSHTRGPAGTSLSSTPGFDLRSEAKRSPPRAPR